LCFNREVVAARDFNFARIFWDFRLR
jgi:hypothetical protein